MLSQAGVKESNGTNFYMKRTTHLNSMASPIYPQVAGFRPSSSV